MKFFYLPQAVYNVPLAQKGVSQAIYWCRTYPNRFRMEFWFELHKNLVEKQMIRDENSVKHARILR